MEEDKLEQLVSRVCSEKECVNGMRQLVKEYQDLYDGTDQKKYVIGMVEHYTIIFKNEEMFHERSYQEMINYVDNRMDQDAMCLQPSYENQSPYKVVEVGVYDS